MVRRLLVPVAALLASALLGGIAAVGIWTAVDDDAPAAAVSASEPAEDTANGSTLSVGELYDRVSPGVVEIEVEPQQNGDGDDGPFRLPEGENPFDVPQPGASGTGFVIDDEGHIVTNEHVVSDAERVTVRFSDGEEARARVVGTDPSTDVALLRLDDPGSHELTPLTLGSAEGLDVGDPVAAIGSPFGLEGTLTTGIVSALDRQIEAPNNFTIDGAIQTDAALNSGNSGGPLLDMRGRVVGITSQIQSRTGGNVGIGYAVPVETVRRVVEQLREGREVRYAYLGVQIADAADEGGARIVAIRQGSPADDAELRAGDVVVEAAGEDVRSGDDLRRAVAGRQPGDELELRVRRGEDTRTVTVELGTRPASTD